MSLETRKVLEMLAAGKITSEDAERLLDKLSALDDQPEGKAGDNREDARTRLLNRNTFAFW